MQTTTIQDAGVEAQDAARAAALRMMGIRRGDGVAVDDCLENEEVAPFCALVVAVLEQALANAKVVASR